MKVLVTGGAGFKGSVITGALLEAGHTVTVFDTMRYGESTALGLLRRGATVIRGDVTASDQIAPQVRRHDAIVHLAALVGFPLCDAEPTAAQAVNVEGTRNVVAAMSADQRLIYASTGSVYGAVDELCTESREPLPLTLYGRTKLDGERIARDAGGVALRFATVVGVSPCMRFDLLLNAFVFRAVHVGWLVLYQPGHRRSFIDVTDAASAYAFAVERAEEMRGEAYNVGDQALNLTKKEVADAVSDQFPMQVITASGHNVDPDQRDYEVAFDKITALGWKAEATLDQVIAEVGAAAQLINATNSWRFTP